jgi:hypothetical protein
MRRAVSDKIVPEDRTVGFRANVLKVMIASPGDVTQERAIVTEEIHRWNDANSSARQLILLPVKWETHSTPQLGEHPQSIINRQLLDEADIVIGIFGTRVGTPTEEYISGTVEEIKKHVAAGKTAKIYFSDVPVAPSTVDAGQYALVQKFREECQSAGLYATFDSLEKFRRDFSHHLDLEMNQPRYRWLAVPADVLGNSRRDFSADAIRLLRAAASSDDGIIVFQSTAGGYGLRAGTEEFLDGTARSRARWKAALEELEDAGTLEQVSEGIYQLAAAGYDVADEIDGQGRDTQHDSDPFKERQRSHVGALIEPLHYMQRDLLRFLLLQGGTARSDVVFRAATNQRAFDPGGLYRPLVENGLIMQAVDHLEGHSTLQVSESMTAPLRTLLFPRDEKDKAPFFKGL